MRSATPRLTVARGARHAEELFLRAVSERAKGSSLAVDSTSALAAPLYVVVPSQSLRLHVMRRLVEAVGSSVVGVGCHTHFGLALRVLDELDMIPPRGLDLFPILARRFARREADLVEALDSLRQGYDGILPAVRDLLDAGFDPAHLEAVEEALGDESDIPASPDELARARAVARVTARTLLAFEELGVGRISILFQAATTGIKQKPEQALSTAGVVLHGFADATGVTADFLATLVETYGGEIIVDRPADPVHPEEEDPSVGFTARLSERFAGFTESQRESASAPPPRVTLFRALGEEAEVREVAQRCLDLIDAGIEPESIGVVMRQPRPYRSVVRRLFTELALPFSAQGLSAPAGPLERRSRAWVEIVTQGSRCHVERWLDAMPARIEGVPLFDLRVALAALGVSRLEQLRTLELDRILSGGSYPLPVRQGFAEAAEEAEETTIVRSERRRVPGAALEALVTAGRRLADRLDEWPHAAAPLDRHVDHLREIVEALGWGPDSPEIGQLEGLLRNLLDAPPVSVDRDEVVLTLRRLASELDREPLGGRGGGVQVMGVVEARGLTFEHLFVLGMNRGTFPRTVREDAVLSDALRKRLERGGHGLLPDLPIKRRGYQEERYLFAQLLSCAPAVTLSWLELDDDDRPMAPSPLIERLRWSRDSESAGWKDPPIAGRRAILDRHPDPATLARRFARLPPREHLVLAASEGGRDELPPRFDAVLRHYARQPSSDGTIDWRRVGRARTAVIDELDPRSLRRAEDCLSPYLGFIGPVPSDGDPRANRQLWVTTVERMASCPWQTFLERLLRVEAVPDPLEALPQIDPLMIGTVVHRVLEQVVASSLGTKGGELDDLIDRTPSRVFWPDEESIERVLEEQSGATVAASGVALQGFSRALAAVARPYLEVARGIEWSDRTTATLAVEANGSLATRSSAGAERLISFRADRVDRDDDGLVLIDYKTGSSPFTQQSAKRRYQRYLAELASGSRLQPAVYAAAVVGPPGRGRFSFLAPGLDLPEAARWVTVSGSDAAVRERLEHVLTTVLDAWEAGFFFPRLQLPEGVAKAPPACKWCRVAEACLRQDSGSRRRLRVGMERLRSGPDRLSGGQRGALLAQWWLATPEHRPDDLAPGEE